MHLLRLCRCILLAFETSDSLLKFLYQVGRAQTLTHFLFRLDQKFSLSECPVGMLQDEGKFVQLLLWAPKYFGQNDSSYLFQAFLGECEQACRGVHDKEFEPTEASEISGPIASDGFNDDNVCGRNDTEALKLSLSRTLNLEFEADIDPVAGNLEIW